jgi:hypothetical protein
MNPIEDNAIMSKVLFSIHHSLLSCNITLRLLNFVPFVNNLIAVSFPKASVCIYFDYSKFFFCHSVHPELGSS